MHAYGQDFLSGGTTAVEASSSWGSQRSFLPFNGWQLINHVGLLLTKSLLFVLLLVMLFSLFFMTHWLKSCCCVTQKVRDSRIPSPLWFSRMQAFMPPESHQWLVNCWQARKPQESHQWLVNCQSGSDGMLCLFPSTCITKQQDFSHSSHYSCLITIALFQWPVVYLVIF